MAWLGFDSLPEYRTFIESGLFRRLVEEYSYETQVRKRGTFKRRQASNTLRKGSPGEWKDYFTPEIKEKVKELIGDELIELGYEENYDW
jgi:hypothetical protein